MRRKIQVLWVVLCILSLMAGTVLAQGKADPNRKLKVRMPAASGAVQGQKPPSHPPLKKDAVNNGVVITTQLGYKAGLLLDNLYYPTGIGVSTRGDSIFFTQENTQENSFGSTNLTQEDSIVSNVYWHHDHTITTIPIPADYLQACRVRGALYVGSGYGEVFKVVDRQYVTYLGDDYYGDYIAALDVDLATGTVYFVVNYYNGVPDGYEYWSGLYKLPRNSTTAILMDEWYDEPCWGLAVKGNLLYITDYVNDSIWTYPKKGGDWNEIVFDLDGPTDIGFDKLGNMFVAEWDGGSIARVKAGSWNGGTVPTLKAGSQNIVRIASGFYSPFYLQLDGYNNIYFTDNYMGQIWKLRK
jgi:hypothetical protein